MREGCGGRRRIRALVALIAVLPTLLVLLTARPAAAATTLEVFGAYDGSFVPGRPVAVRVRISADRLLRGRLDVLVSHDAPVSLPVEVPGGSTKEFLIVVPRSEAFPTDGVAPVQVWLRDGGDEIASGRAALRSSVGEELVGLLPGALGGRGVPGPAALTIDAGTARFTALGPAELAQAPASLGPVSTIGAAPDELGRLPGTTRAALLSWVEQGGHLLVDADPGQTVEGLPLEWQPGADGRAPAGRGEVRLTGGAMAGGRWAGLVEPTGWTVPGVPSTFFGEGVVGRALADQAGLRVPRLGWLVAFLVVYVLVAGPLVFFVVRRRQRPELAWVAVPLVAVLFTAGSYVGGRGLRDTTRQVDSNVVFTGATGSTAATWLGVFSAGGQTSRIRFGPGWLPGGTDFESGATTLLSSLVLTGDGADGTLPLDAGQFGVVTASGPVDTQGRLEVTGLSSTQDQASGRVRNGTPFPLEEVAVFVGGDATAIGTLGPGEEREWRVTTIDRNFAFDGGQPSEAQVWTPDGFDWSTPDDNVDFSLWTAAQELGGSEFRGPGAVVAAGWTRSFAPPVEVDGKGAGRGGRTLVIGQARLDAAADVLDIRREVVRAPDFRGGRSDSFVVRFVIRDTDRGGRAPDPSRLTVTGPIGQLESWHDGGWFGVDPTSRLDLEQIGWAEFLMPPSAVQGDVLYVRVPGFGSGIDSTGLFTLEERT